MRNTLRHIAKERGEWAGIPMPIEGEKLIIEPRYPMAQALSTIYDKPEDEAEKAGYKVRNTFWSTKWRSDIMVVEKDGKISWGLIPGVHHWNYDMSTLMCSLAWGIEQEHRAVTLLGNMISHHQLKQYMLTGIFMEKSRRSGLTYAFRRLKPTVVIDARDETDGSKPARIICCLCMHPIGYYRGSWAGAQCPTDDVVAHLSMMRGDEPMYWRRASQHPAWRPEAGL